MNVYDLKLTTSKTQKMTIIKEFYGVVWEGQAENIPDEYLSDKKYYETVVLAISAIDDCLTIIIDR